MSAEVRLYVIAELLVLPRVDSLVRLQRIPDHVRLSGGERARSAEQPPCHSTALIMTTCRFAMSATAPAGNVRRKKGAAAAVAMSDSANEEAPAPCINHVAATSCADTNVPERTLASQSRANTGFRSANQVDVEVFVSVANPAKIPRDPGTVTQF